MRLICYYRVSTRQQGESGLGLEGQQASVEAYARANGATIISTYTEVESGKNNSRPQLRKAMAHARRSSSQLK
jgi:DNA invertase Pin-like site-specific DNA recombinase